MLVFIHIHVSVFFYARPKCTIVSWLMIVESLSKTANDTSATLRDRVVALVKLVYAYDNIARYHHFYATSLYNYYQLLPHSSASSPSVGSPSYAAGLAGSSMNDRIASCMKEGKVWQDRAIETHRRYMSLFEDGKAPDQQTQLKRMMSLKYELPLPGDALANRGNEVYWLVVESISNSVTKNNDWDTKY
jgi:hypothetical protein